MYANSAGPDQTPRSSAFDLGLHCLPMSKTWDATPERVSYMNVNSVR